MLVVADSIEDMIKGWGAKAPASAAPKPEKAPMAAEPPKARRAPAAAPKSIEDKYRKLTDIEHVLHRPGMYVGSTNSREEDVYLISEGKFQKSKVLWNPAFMKIFDEIISNSVDEHRRNPKLNEIRVTVSQPDGRITIRDNGGIPVVKHQVHDEWVPEMIFSSLKAGSNFNDEEQRLVAGTNGVGSTLTNIFSLEFTVRTSDGKNRFEQTFRKNMTERDEAEVAKTRGPGYTEISFVPDLAQFGMGSIDDEHVKIMQKRCLDLAACNQALRIFFNDEEYKFGSFREYCALYADAVVYEESPRWKIGVAPSDGSFTQVSFVNSVETRDGGTHVDYVAQQIVAWIRERVRKKHKLELKPGELRNHFFLFVQSDIVNPGFSSQTKEKLITEPKDFGSKYEIDEKTLKEIFASEVVQRILDWAQQKSLAEERKQLRELNKNLSKEKVLKLIDAKAREGRSRCTLALFEGDSASSAFRKYRDPMLQGAFPLRGKFINVSELPNTRVIQNQEVKDLLAAIGLKMGEEPKDLRYGKILIYSDADPDGDSIAGLLINFFGKYWPELFARGRICRVLTPLVVVEKGAEKHCFYTNTEFEEWSRATRDLGKWNIAYKKGLAALEDDAYMAIIKHPKIVVLSPGENMSLVLNNWFGSDPSARKDKILGATSGESE